MFHKTILSNKPGLFQLVWLLSERERERKIEGGGGGERERERERERESQLNWFNCIYVNQLVTYIRVAEASGNWND